uniref:UDP-glucose/GDP-mannose dehydrogenase dimerisation domain-containing protein n=1 Tax=viral metagenome TaxID=1070528 RepID=A0A6C0HGB4_9ZZZZ
MIQVGICGCGFVGNAILQFLLTQFGITLRVYDKYKNLNKFEWLLNSDILFICLPTNYDEKIKTYDMTEIDSTLNELSKQNFTGIILMKSTVLPTYCSDKNKVYPNLNIIHNPEFLSASTAVVDFSNQTHIILGHTTQSISYINTVQHFYKKLFPLADISVCTSEESAIAKLACNSFYATKIHYFTEVYLLCDKMNIPYNTIKELMLKNGWIDSHHTNVPGHDNRISFGGACFPKDINAFAQYMIANEIPSDVLQAVIKERNRVRCWVMDL